MDARFPVCVCERLEKCFPGSQLISLFMVFRWDL
jgi:hypothetical protein